MALSLLKGIAGGIALFAFAQLAHGYSAAIAMPSVVADLALLPGWKLFFWSLIVEHGISLSPLAVVLAVWLARSDKHAYFSALCVCLTFLVSVYVWAFSAERLAAREWWSSSLEVAVFLYMYGAVWLGLRITSQGNGDGLSATPA